MKEIMIYFLLFILYSFIGWIIEVINSLIMRKKVVNRGFLIGPYCPIYGFGTLFMVLLLTKYQDDPFGLFVKSMVICAVLEYFTSLLMEKMFKMRWWDYSKRKFNIDGRICLETMVMFGFGGLVVIYLLNPFFMTIINHIPTSILIGLDIFLFIIFLLDNIISFNIINNFKKSSVIRKDSTEDVNEKVKQSLMNNYFVNRLMMAFPKLTPIVKNYDKTLKKIEKQKRRIKKEKIKKNH